MPAAATILSDHALWFAERQPTGFLVALWLDPETAAKLALSGGESPDSLHITLCYCGAADDLGELAQARAIASIDQVVRWWNPLEGKVAGYGRFIGTESSEGQDVFYATPDIPALVELRNAISNALLEAGVSYSTAHGYAPHITLAYLDSGAANPVKQLDPTPLMFSGVTVMAGSRRVDIPFWSAEPALESPIAMSEESADVPLTAPLGTFSARPLLFSFAQEWISFLPVPGTYSHRHYGTMDLSDEKYARIVANFKANTYGQDLPINAEHDAAASGAVGWIRDMRIASDGSIEVKPEWNDRGTALIEGDRFRYVSAEFCNLWQDPVSGVWHQDVAVGLAICTRPHFKTDVLKPLAASEALAFAEVNASTNAGDAGEGTNMADEPTTTTAAPVTEPVTTDPSTAPTTATAPVVAAEVTSPIVLSDLTTVVISAEQRQQERRQFADLTSRVELAERRAETAETGLKTLQKERRVEKFTAEVMGRSPENGVAWFGAIADNVNHLVSLAESHGDDSAEVRWAVTQKRNEARAIQASGIFDPIGSGSHEDVSTVNAQVDRMAEQIRLSEPALSPAQARARVYDANPDLYKRSLNAG